MLAVRASGGSTLRLRNDDNGGRRQQQTEWREREIAACARQRPRDTRRELGERLDARPFAGLRRDADGEGEAREKAQVPVLSVSQKRRTPSPDALAEQQQEHVSTWMSGLASYCAFISVLSSSHVARSDARIFNFNGSLNAAESRLQHHPTPITPQLRVWPSPFRPLYACGGSTHLQSHSGVHAGSSALLSLE